MLCHYYVHSRSTIVVLDTCFDSVFYQDKALGFVKEVFKDLLPTDHFCLIKLDAFPETCDIPLERKECNTEAKLTYL